MSAWDIAGAVVWTFLAVTGTGEFVTTLPADKKGAAVVILTPVWLATVYCISRLFGAT